MYEIVTHGQTMALYSFRIQKREKLLSSQNYSPVQMDGVNTIDYASISLDVDSSNQKQAIQSWKNKRKDRDK